jgi:hypothetical protein
MKLPREYLTETTASESDSASPRIGGIDRRSLVVPQVLMTSLEG